MANGNARRRAHQRKEVLSPVPILSARRQQRRGGWAVAAKKGCVVTQSMHVTVRLYATQGLLAGVRTSEARRPNTGCFMTHSTHVCGYTQHKTCLPACAPARHRAQCPCNPPCSFSNMRRQLRIQSRDKVSARVGQLGGMPRHGRKGASLRARRRPQQRAHTTTDARASLERQIVGLHGALKRCNHVALLVKNSTSCVTPLSRANFLRCAGLLDDRPQAQHLRPSRLKAAEPSRLKTAAS